MLKQKPATPAQAPASVRAPRSARLSISESTRPVLKGEDEDYPEVEYCPPQPVRMLSSYFASMMHKNANI